MLLYHGNNVLIKKPMLNKQTKFLDFGFGFYTVINRWQAKFDAEKAVASRGGIATINTYELNYVEAKKLLDIKNFANPNEVWLDFVADNRSGLYVEDKSDLIIGAVGYGDVYRKLQLYLTGVLSKKNMLDVLKDNKWSRQYVFKTDKAIKLLKFVKSEEV